jgi:uncharacterized protein (TIGR02118 family)
MYRVTVLYEIEPDEQEYAAHAEMCRCVPGSEFRHGKVMGAPMGEAPHAYYAEWEFPDKEAFDAAVRSEEFMATGKDAYKRGFPQPTVQFVELSD